MRRLFRLPYLLLHLLYQRSVSDMQLGRNRYEKEALLRDPHEYTAAIAYLVAAIGVTAILSAVISAI